MIIEQNVRKEVDMNKIDISDLDKDSQEIFLKIVDCFKRKNYLENIVKELSKLI